MDGSECNSDRSFSTNLILVTKNDNNSKSMKGEVLGRYQIEQQLGKRAGRRTLLARDNQTQELVVVKLLSFSTILNGKLLSYLNGKRKL
jgi:hypothetical protein